MPLTLFLVMGVAEIGRAHFWRLNIASSAHAGVLYASRSLENAQNAGEVRTRVLAELTDVPSSSGTPNVTVTLGAAGGDGYGKRQVTVTVDMTLVPLFTLPGMPTQYTLREADSARVLEIELRS
jgi:hypothetical protein